MPQIDLSILNQRQTPAFYADTLANRPAAGFIGRIFVSTDTFAFYRDNGTGWDLIGGPGTGTITGSGLSGQIALWTGASTIGGISGLTYGLVDSSLTASKFIVTGGTSSDFLKGDGSLDNSAYITASALTSYVPYTGATANVDLGAFDLTADLITGATGSFTSSGGSNTFGITHTSGSGIALNITKDGNGEGLFITKGSGSGNAATINGGLVKIENNSSDAQLQIVSSSAPSVRIDNAATGATKRAGLGISTAVNNFIQGSADRDYCIFNSSTTASPILFGIYDAGLTNTQEAARISPARNFLVGTTTDAGQRLQISGTALITSSVTTNSKFESIFSNTSTTFDANAYLRLVNTGAATLDQSVDLVMRWQDGTYNGTGGISMVRESATARGGKLVFQPIDASGNNLTALTITSTGNVGIGVTPNLWGSAYKAVQISSGASFYGLTTDNRYAVMAANTYNNGTNDIYIGNGAASLYVQGIGAHIWYNANSGTAGNNITFNPLMTLAATGNLLIGTTTDNGEKLQVNGRIQSTGFKSFTGTKSIASGATETVYTIPSGTGYDGLYFVQVEITTGSSIYLASGVVTALSGNNEAFFTSFYDGANVTLSVSGLNIQVTNGGFATFTWNYTILFQPL